MVASIERTLWTHQRNGIAATIEAVQNAKHKIVLTAPCGAGKTAMMIELIRWANGLGMPVALYTSRKMLRKQTANVLESSGIDFGQRASGCEPALLRDVQLCMTPSELQAVYKQKRRELHRAKLVLIDEIHMQGGAAMEQIIADHLAAGSVVVAFTATPLDLLGEWDELIVAGTNSELRQCGAHVPAVHYCPDAPDLKHVKKYRVGEDLSDRDNAKVMMRPGVFGRVYDNWKRFNPDGNPTILFAPDVAGSIYFAEQFHGKGVSVAHIDAKSVWWDGELHPKTDDLAEDVLRRSEIGDIQILCNRFVLREGIDLPHIACAIMATVFGSLTSYLQSGGRVIRSHPSLTEVTVIDHGGNYVRHGSLNADRNWELGQSSYKTTGLRAEGMRERPETEPIVCPKCHACRLSGPKCHKCGYMCSERARIVVQIDGNLKQVDGPSFKPRRVALKPDTAKLWEQMYFRAKSKKWNATFNQAEALFFYENHYYPPRTLTRMPRDPADWFEKVNNVPPARLQ